MGQRQQLMLLKLNSKTALEFYKRLELVYPLKEGIDIVQTDNGSEFEGEFDRYLKHIYSYPRCPKINGYVERANRTLQEEFVNLKEDVILDSLNELNKQLIDYLVWDNTKRVHKGLNNQTPIDYTIKNYPQECQMYGTYTQ